MSSAPPVMAPRDSGQRPVVALDDVEVSQGADDGAGTMAVQVRVLNPGHAPVAVQDSDFALMTAEGDVLALAGRLSPGDVIDAGQTLPVHLAFAAPPGALRGAALMYTPPGAAGPTFVSLSETAAFSEPAAPSGVAAAADGVVVPAASVNTIEDNFTRANQTGWGTSTNGSGLANVAWGMDGTGASFVTIASNRGRYGYPGSINVVGIASAGTATYDGGDALVQFTLTAVGHVNPYVALNACSDKSCYYGARLHTSQGVLEIARREDDETEALTTVPFVAQANQAYWMRLHVTAGSSDTLSAKIWPAGSAEPGWMASVVDTSPLDANRVGAGGTWDVAGSGEAILYACYAFAATGTAAECSGGATPTATSTATSAATATSTRTPTRTATPASSATATRTATSSATATRTATATATRTATPTSTATATKTAGPSATPSPTATPTTASPNTIEDNFTRGNQSGWGTTTNGSGLPNVAWGMDGSGSSFVQIASNSGQYGYPGSINVVGIASAGAGTYNGGDALVQFTLTTVGHVNPYVALNACGDKSCYYGARLHTSQNVLEIARRSGNTTQALTTVPFTAQANQAYWLRLHVTAGSSDTLSAKIWPVGSAEPGWLATVADPSPLAANRVGAGGTWDVAGSGEAIRYACFAFSASGTALPCAGAVPPTATATSTSTTLSTATPTRTATAVGATATATRTATATATSTQTGAQTATPTRTPTRTSTATPTATRTATATATPTGTAVIARDTFQRSNQSLWGTASDGHIWAGDANTSDRFSINGGRGQIAQADAPLNAVLGASAGDSEVLFTASLDTFDASNLGAVLHWQNANNLYKGLIDGDSIVIQRRLNGTSTDIATGPFTANAGTAYSIRFQIRGSTLAIKAWPAGSAEPGGWMLSVVDSSVGSGFAGLRIQTSDSSTALVTSFLATLPSGSPPPTPTPVPTPGLIEEFPLTGGVGYTWGTAFDGDGNLWIAESGCDFTPMCPANTPPGQIAKIAAGSTTAEFFTLPNIPGNQPIFVDVDANGDVWFTTPNNSMIGQFDPDTETFVGQWAVTAGSGPWDLDFNNGMLWYTEHYVSAIGRFNPVTHAHTDFPTPTDGTFPYGMTAHDPTNPNLIWFTENSPDVAGIAVLDTSNGNAISEYPIRADLSGVTLTPHQMTIDDDGIVWWSEGWVRSIGSLDRTLATPGVCGVSSGNCDGVVEYALPDQEQCFDWHVSGIVAQPGSHLLWLDDSLSAEVGSFDTQNHQFFLRELSDCGKHPHDGLVIEANNRIWWDEEFWNQVGRLTQ